MFSTVIRSKGLVGCLSAVRLRSRVALRYASSNAEVLAKYKQKLEMKAKNLGLESVEQLQEQLKDDIEKRKKEMNAADPLKELEEYEKRQQEELEKDRQNRITKVRSPIAKDVPKLPYKTLNSFVDIEKINELPRKELEFIWKARFQNNPRNLYAILTDLQFANMFANAFKNPSFILPLPKSEEGYEMHFVQWSFVGPSTTHCMLTTVAEYKLHKEYAKPHTTLMFHQELAGTKGMVLMNGQVEKEASLTMDEAQLLVLNVQRFYGGIGDPEKAKAKLQILREFTEGKADFDMQKLIDEATSFE